MSEEILKALMHLFAIITKQDGGVEENEKKYVRNFLSQQLGESESEEYYNLFLRSSEQDEKKDFHKEEEHNLTSVLDSVKILGICKKINKTLNQSQKIVVLVRLFELVVTGDKLTTQRMAIINTIADVFRISGDEFKSLETFVLEKDPERIDNSNILIINARKTPSGNTRHIITEQLHKDLVILRIPESNLYFIKYTGREDLFLNGLGLHKDRIYLFARGSAVKLPKGKPVYYSDIAAHFMLDTSSLKLSFQVENIEYRFKNGHPGLRNISFSAIQGNLIGIMGASGTGKTTLLNVLAGIDTPSKGTIRVNGFEYLKKEGVKLKGTIGFIPQDDLLIEELTVFQNLYYNAKLCFRDLPEKDIMEKVELTLQSLGLYDKKDLKVGSPFNKTISGGQRKRLNIALELIREPSILFIDEPTSGLSSRDSENVMDLLRELTLKGKLIFTVIHQPSSEIYKMFDRVIIMDEGGYMIYFGNPVEGVMYFKTLDAQINSEIGECPACGNVNPELIFNIIEARVVDEYGNYTYQRKVIPSKWEEYYHRNIREIRIDENHQEPPKSLKVPRWHNQLKIFTIRDFLSKLSNRQYLILTLLEAPVLGFILSYIIRYIADPSSNTYIFRENENIPIYIFMVTIVSLFLGLTLSAEEIFRDRKILKREKFLNLSRSGYLLAKLSILFFISAIQALSFVLVANSIIEIKGMNFFYWLAFFSTAAFANMLGLNISSGFDSAITIYILIPLVMIPMMVLSGAMFSFDKLNSKISRIDQVSLLAEFMPTKWSYEALMVHQFKDNNFEYSFYEVEKKISNSDYKQSYYIPELQDRIKACEDDFRANGKLNSTKESFELIRNEILNEQKVSPSVKEFDVIFLTNAEFTMELSKKLDSYLSDLNMYYLELFSSADHAKTNHIRYLIDNEKQKYYSYLDKFHNEAVADQVRKIYERKKIVEYKGRLIRKIDPVFMDPLPESFIGIRSHFFAPRKYFMGRYYDTFKFNMAIIWILTLILYITLYFDILRKLVNFSLSKYKKEFFRRLRPGPGSTPTA
jgi:ABC transport system ATP-binding/permease protein